MSGINLISIYLADGVGLLLMLLVLISKGWELPGRDEESHILFMLIISSIINCIIDPYVFWVDGKSGLFCYIVAKYGNSVLFIYNLIVGAGLLGLIAKHINKKIEKFQHISVCVILVIECLLLVVNIFVPVVFSIDENNVYKRGPLYFIYILAALYLLLYSLYLYITAKYSEGSLRYFPVWEFVVPILIGVIIQTIFYGVSSQRVGFAIAFCVIMVNLQKEQLYVDKLTGVYNRFELDVIRMILKKRKKKYFAAIMCDMNDFKSINDNYSHKEGDIALQEVAKILLKAAGSSGNVIRFAGDEFIVIINSGEKNVVTDYCDRVDELISAFNSSSGKPYKLSISMGGDIFELGDETDYLARIDELMYSNKKIYYQDHDRRSNKY